MKKLLAKTMKKATALMLAILLLFSCAVNVMPERLLTAEAESGAVITVKGAGTITWGSAVFFNTTDIYNADGEIDWGRNVWDSDGALSYTGSDNTATVSVPTDTAVLANITVWDAGVNSNVTLSVPATTATYYISSDGSYSTTNPADVFSPFTVTVIGYGKDGSNLVEGQAGVGLSDGSWSSGVWTNSSASDDNVNVDVTSGKLVITVKSADVKYLWFGLKDANLDNLWLDQSSIAVGSLASVYYMQADGTLSTTAPTYADETPSDSDVSDTDVSDSDVSDSDVSDSDADNTFAVDTSAYSGNVWGSYIDADGNEQWYNWDNQDVVAQDWAGNICTLLVKAAISSITLGVGDLEKIPVELGGFYYATADGIVEELPSGDEDVSDSDVSDTDVPDTDVSDSDVPEEENKFYIDTTDYTGDVWGSYTDAEGNTQWYNWGSQDVITQTWDGNVCTLEVIGEASDITLGVGSLATIDVEMGGYYYSSADGITENAPSDDEEVSDSDVSDSDVSDSDVSDSDLPDESEYATGTIVIDTTEQSGNVWGSYVDQNGETKWFSWDDQSVISQSWSGYYCTLTVKEPAARITLAVYPLDAVDVQVGGRYHSTPDGIVEGDRVSDYVPPVIEKGVDSYVVLHYVRADGNYDGWGVGIWGEVAPGVWKDETIMLKTDKDGLGLVELDENGFDKDGYKVALIPMASYPVDQLGFKLHQNNWAVEDSWNKDRYIDVTKLTAEEPIHVYVYEGVEEIFYDKYDEANHNKFFAASSGSVLGAFATGMFSTSSTSTGNSATGSVVAVCVISSVLAVAGVAVLAWYMNSVRKEEENF